MRLLDKKGQVFYTRKENAFKFSGVTPSFLQFYTLINQFAPNDIFAYKIQWTLNVHK